MTTLESERTRERLLSKITADENDHWAEYLNKWKTAGSDPASCTFCWAITVAIFKKVVSAEKLGTQLRYLRSFGNNLPYDIYSLPYAFFGLLEAVGPELALTVNPLDLLNDVVSGVCVNYDRNLYNLFKSAENVQLLEIFLERSATPRSIKNWACVCPSSRCDEPNECFAHTCLHSGTGKVINPAEFDHWRSLKCIGRNGRKTNTGVPGVLNINRKNKHRTNSDMAEQSTAVAEASDKRPFKSTRSSGLPPNLLTFGDPPSPPAEEKTAEKETHSSVAPQEADVARGRGLLVQMANRLNRTQVYLDEFDVHMGSADKMSGLYMAKEMYPACGLCARSIIPGAILVLNDAVVCYRELLQLISPPNDAAELPVTMAFDTYLDKLQLGDQWAAWNSVYTELKPYFRGFTLEELSKHFSTSPFCHINKKRITGLVSPTDPASNKRGRCMVYHVIKGIALLFKKKGWPSIRKYSQAIISMSEEHSLPSHTLWPEIEVPADQDDMYELE